VHLLLISGAPPRVHAGAPSRPQVHPRGYTSPPLPVLARAPPGTPQPPA